MTTDGEDVNPVPERQDERDGAVDRVRAWLRAVLPGRRPEQRPLWRPLPPSGEPALLPVPVHRRRRPPAR